MEQEIEMPWIESHTEIERHRKIKLMAADLGIPPVYLSGHMHALWHNVLEQQEDGDLTGWPASLIAEMALYTGDAQMFVSMLKKHGFLDHQNDAQKMLIHDWLDYANKYLWRKYHSTNPAKYNAIIELYFPDENGTPKVRPKKSTHAPARRLVKVKLSSSKYHIKILEESFKKFWDTYPKRVSKIVAERAWRKLDPSDDLVEVIIAAVEKHKQTHSWQKDNGQYVPNPATWLNQRKWTDEIDQGNFERIKNNGAAVYDIATMERFK
jgi:hypothetical protein